MNNQIHIQNFISPVGELILGSFNNQLCICDWRYRKMRSAIDSRIKTQLNAAFIIKPSPIIQETITQINQYFKGERTEFEIDLLMVGTSFQKLVWQELLKIPYGKTQTYLELSKQLGNPKAIRAVATANGANAISIIVPCHRIIGSDGSLVGYAGGLTAKKKLISLENPESKSQLSLF